MKSKNSFLILLLISSFTMFGQNLIAQDSTSISADIGQFFSDYHVGAFENYLSDEKELTEKGTLQLKWNSSYTEQQLFLRYKYEDEAKWEAYGPFPASQTSYTLDSILENESILWSIGNGQEWAEVNKAYTISQNVFENIMVHSGAESARLTWSVNYRIAEKAKSDGLMGVVAYNTDIRKKRMKSGMEGNDWMLSEPFHLLDNEIELNDLIGNETYHFKIGFISNESSSDIDSLDDASVIWSVSKKAKTKRDWGIAKLLILIGSLGFFIYGMKLMSEGLQQASGNMLRSMLRAITANRVKGVFTGFGITSLVQSSSVTTVMTVSFVNAGLLTLRQSAGVMMGS